MLWARRTPISVSAWTTLLTPMRFKCVGVKHVLRPGNYVRNTHRLKKYAGHDTGYDIGADRDYRSVVVLNTELSEAHLV